MTENPIAANKELAVDKSWTNYASTPLQPFGVIDPLCTIIERVTEDHLVAMARIEVRSLEGEGVHARRRAAVLSSKVLDVPERNTREYLLPFIAQLAAEENSGS